MASSTWHGRSDEAPPRPFHRTGSGPHIRRSRSQGRWQADQPFGADATRLRRSRSQVVRFVRRRAFPRSRIQPRWRGCFPLAQSFLFRLEAEAAAPGFCPDALQRATQSAAIEVGEAVAALVGATRLGATPADRALARREAEQAMTALSHTLPMLDETVSPGGTVFTGGSTRP